MVLQQFVPFKLPNAGIKKAANPVFLLSPQCMRRRLCQKQNRNSSDTPGFSGILPVKTSGRLVWKVVPFTLGRPFFLLWTTYLFTVK